MRELALRTTSRTRQQHVNSKWRFVPVSFVLRFAAQCLFRFDFTREFVFRTTLTWWGSQVRSRSFPRHAHQVVKPFGAECGETSRCRSGLVPE